MASTHPTKRPLALVTPFKAGRTAALPSDLAAAQHAPDGGRIPISEFLIPSHDAQGHSVTLMARCPPATRGQIESIVASPGSPFKDTSAFLRWAILRGCRHWADQRKDSMVSNLQAVVDIQVSIYQEQQYLSMLTKSVQDLTNVLNMLEGMGKFDKARMVLKDAVRRTKGIDDPEWREHWLREVRNRFGHLLHGGGGRKKGARARI